MKKGISVFSRKLLGILVCLGIFDNESFLYILLV